MPLTSMERSRSNFGILINQQTTMLNGASVPTAATHNPATTSTPTRSRRRFYPGSRAPRRRWRWPEARTGRSAERDQHQRWYFARALQQHLNQQQLQQLHLNQQQLLRLQQLQSQQSQQQQQLDLGGITMREAPLSQIAAALAPKPEPAPPPPVKPNDPASQASQTLASISDLSNQLAGVSPLLGLGSDSAGTGLDPGGGGGGGAGLAGGGGSLANGAGLNLGGLGAGLAAQPGLLYLRQYP